MGEWVYCNFYKSDAQTPVIGASNVYVQFEKMDQREAMEYQGGDPHFVYKCYTSMLPTNDLNLIQQRYYLIDQQTIDPTTNQHRKYLIISDPHAKTLMMAWEFVAYRYRGT